ncbi:hypothetical protein KGP26_19595 [Serratia sp. JSRIV002]|uniref:hypothetical protein n=1 Tax=Serratia sp. JSRIV002 TaxID=2831894 RepID=UPI001CBE939B|nr:hypothetical protein [Serratia sp. JSRIV002]UAN49953.1 hypothetical protein KGP26_19595 [Serratia sp. JSRIV002]
MTISSEQVQEIYEAAVHEEATGDEDASFDLLCKLDDAGGTGATIRKLIDMVRARDVDLLAVREAQSVPVGFQLVPVEPTEDMVIDGFESEAFNALADAVLDKKGWPYSCRESAECVKGIFQAMLAAAPKAD